jgi:hypothetical protein
VGVSGIAAVDAEELGRAASELGRSGAREDPPAPRAGISVIVPVDAGELDSTWSELAR